MTSEKPKDLGCADVGSKYRVRNIATTEAQCRQSSVQCTPIQRSMPPILRSMPPILRSMPSILRSMPPILRSMHAPTGQKLPARGKRAQRATPRVSREPVRYAPTGQKQRQERSNPAHENIRHVAPHPAPRPTPIINLARTRVYIRKTNPSKNVSTLQPSFKTR